MGEWWWVGGLKLPVDTGSRAVCSVVATVARDKVDIGSSCAPHPILLMPLSGPIGSVVTLHSLTRSSKNHL